MRLFTRHTTTPRPIKFIIAYLSFIVIVYIFGTLLYAFQSTESLVNDKFLTGDNVPDIGRYVVAFIYLATCALAIWSIWLLTHRRSLATFAFITMGLVSYGTYELVLYYVGLSTLDVIFGGMIFMVADIVIAAYLLRSVTARKYLSS